MAAKNVLDITIRLIKEGGADKDTVAGLVSVKNAIMGAAQVAGTLTAAYYAVDKVFDATVGTMVAYADQVRTIQNATGATSESASQLIQILDDQKISFEQLEKVVAKNGKTYDYSIAGIAAMSDEYLKLGSANEQAAFMQERFGKAWIDFVPIMKQGGEAIRGAADAVSQNLILTQKAVDAAREYEMSMDSLNDSIEGVKIALGLDLLPTMNQFLDGVQVFVRAMEIANEKGGQFKFAFWNIAGAMDQATQDVAANKLAMQDHAAVVAQDTENEKANAEAVKQVSAAHQSMLGLITSVATETQSYSAKQAELTANMEANRAEAEKLYPYQKAELADLNNKYTEMQASYQANADAHSAAMGKIQYDLLMTRLSVDGLTDAEFEMAQQAGVAFGVFDEASVSVAKAMMQVQKEVEAGTLKIGDMQAALDMLVTGKYSIDVVVNTLVKTASDFVTGHEQGQGMQGGFAEGGISTGPTSGHMELLHGTEAVIPLQNGSIPVQMQGAPAVSGSNITINLTYAPGFSTADAAELERNLMPLIKRGVLEARR